MRTRTLPPNSAVALHGIWAILLLAFVVAALYFGRTVFVPIALATLITFLLSRLVSRLEKWIGRVTSVLLCVVVAFTIVGAVSWIVGRQVVDLAGNLPRYQENITRKIHSLRLPAGTLARLTSSVDTLQKEVINATPAPAPKEQTTDLPSAKTGASPIPVKIIEGRNAIPQLVQENIAAVLGPIGRSALVFLLVIFMLLKREDLRGRMIRLIGQGRISATTRAMEDAASRVSRYLSMQFLVNTCYGICVAVGLYFIGIPNAALWGLLAGVLRFIPYIGPWAGAALPLILSFAISDNWISPVLTTALFILLEVTISNFVEPWLYGASTGVSPIALIISAVFWTWLWGPIGLVLSTPLTVCLAVMGRHAPRLEFLSVLLSEDQPLAPHEEFYYHVLALRGEGAEEFALNYTEAHSLQALYEDVLLPATRVVETDGASGAITADQRTAALQRIHEIVESVSHATPTQTEEEPASGIIPVAGARVLCVPAGGYGDELAGEMLVRLLRRQGFVAQNMPARLKREELMAKAIEFDPESVCISVVPPSGMTHARNVNEALHTRLVSVKTLVGVWDSGLKKENATQRLRASGATEVAVSLAEAVSALVKMTAPIAEKMMAAPIPSNEEARMAELEGLNLLDTPPEENFDHITERLTRLFKVPIALLTLVDKDRQWFKSHKGLPEDLDESRSTPRDVSLCGHVVANDDMLTVRDLARDPRFANNPFVKQRGLRFYAGVPLHGPNGLAIGTLCIMDTKPRELSAQEQELFKAIAEDAMEDIKRRRVLDDRTPRTVAKS